MPVVVAVVPHTLNRNESAVKLYPKAIDSSSAAIQMIDDNKNHDSDDTLMKVSSESSITTVVESFHEPSVNVMMKEEIDGDTLIADGNGILNNNNSNNNSSSTSMESPCIDHQANIQSLPTDIDQSVFYALPISIQKEILDSISNHRQSSMCMSPSVKADVDGRDDFQFIHNNNKRMLSKAHSPPLLKKHRKAVASTPSGKASNRKVINAVIDAKGYDNKQSKLSNWLISNNNSSSSSSSSHLKS